MTPRRRVLDRQETLCVMVLMVNGFAAAQPEHQARFARLMKAQVRLPGPCRPECRRSNMVDHDRPCPTKTEL